jgi:hypothetical protein
LDADERDLLDHARADLHQAGAEDVSRPHSPARIGAALLDGWARANLSMSAVEWLCNKAVVHRRNITCDRRGVIIDQ